MKNKVSVYSYKGDYRESFTRDKRKSQVLLRKKLGEERRERIHVVLHEEQWARRQTALPAVWPYTLRPTSMSLFTVFYMGRER